MIHSKIELDILFYGHHCAAFSVAQKSVKCICAGEGCPAELTFLYVHPIILRLRPVRPYLIMPLKILRRWPLVARGKENFGSRCCRQQTLVALNLTFPPTVW